MALSHAEIIWPHTFLRISQILFYLQHSTRSPKTLTFRGIFRRNTMLSDIHQTIHFSLVILMFCVPVSCDCWEPTPPFTTLKSYPIPYVISPLPNKSSYQFKEIHITFLWMFAYMHDASNLMNVRPKFLIKTFLIYIQFDLELLTMLMVATSTQSR